MEPVADLCERMGWRVTRARLGVSLLVKEGLSDLSTYQRYGSNCDRSMAAGAASVCRLWHQVNEHKATRGEGIGFVARPLGIHYNAVASRIMYYIAIRGGFASTVMW